MPYGPPKYSLVEVKRIILDLVDAEIQKNSDFSSDNLSCYGFEVDFSAKIVLVVRNKEIAIPIESVLAGGELHPIPDPDGPEHNEPERKETQASGRRRHGKARPVPQGS